MKVFTFILVILLSCFDVSAGENGGVATGEQFQAWAVDLDTPYGPITLYVEPYSGDNPYFGWPMTPQLLKKIVHDCGIAAQGDCAYDGHYPVTVRQSRWADPFAGIATPDQAGTQSSYLWSDAFQLDDQSKSYLWFD